MKNLAKVAICFASGLVLNTGLCVDHEASNNPYEAIVTRNVFNLNPPQAHEIKTPEPPSKITVDGIMTIFGGAPQALYNVAVPPHPPKPATKKSYILGEGQGQDDIEVRHIDMKNGLVTFNNHGVVQEIPLTKAPPITTPTPVVVRTGSAPPHLPNSPANRAGNRAGLSGRFGHSRNFSATARNFGNTGGNTANTAGSYGGTAAGSAGGTTQTRLSPEEQMIMIAAQHAEAQKQGNPIAKIFPPTPLDEAAGVAPNTSPSSTTPVH